ncbi:MAG TPA: hypothetical protein VHW47_08155 [Acidimicrobiales bacterium]|jgi:hypothetical protein|nr:hypothetical protein [Acidimicrobiales bacterium]
MADDLTADLASIGYLPETMAAALHATVGEVVGIPMSLAFRVETGQPDRLFLSGLVPETAGAAGEALGGRLVPSPAAGRTAGGGTVVTLATEVWGRSGGDGGPAIGTGPVVLPPGAGTSGELAVVTIEAGERPTIDRLARVERLRATLRQGADRLEREVATEVDWALLTATAGKAGDWLVLALDQMARTRSAVGAYLIDVADDIDDERIDQLGDGYVRAGELWRDMPKGDAALGDEVHQLERACVDWMRKAADPPTRYAF